MASACVKYIMLSNFLATFRLKSYFALSKMAEMKNGVPYKKISGRQGKLAKGYQPKPCEYYVIGGLLLFFYPFKSSVDTWSLMLCSAKSCCAPLKTSVDVSISSFTWRIVKL